MPFLDFEAIKADYPINRVVDIFKLELRMRGEQWRGKCPVCEGGSERNLVITPSKGVYYCFSDEKGGDQLALISHMRGCSAKEAAEWLAGDAPQRSTAPKEKKQEASDGFKPLDYLEADHDAVLALGFDPDVALALGIGYAKRGILKGTVAVPLRRDDGSISGYIGLTEIEKLPAKWHL